MLSRAFCPYPCRYRRVSAQRQTATPTGLPARRSTVTWKFGGSCDQLLANGPGWQGASNEPEAVLSGLNGLDARLRDDANVRARRAPAVGVGLLGLFVGHRAGDDHVVA